MVDVGPAGAASSGSSQNNSNSGEEDKKDERMFECNICLDTAKDAVISMCGHLFCWPCLHQWLETRPARQMCPVCKAAISKEKVIPLYGRGSSKQEDPRNKAPPRPAGQRTEPEANATSDQWWTDEESSDAEFILSSNSSGNDPHSFLDTSEFYPSSNSSGNDSDCISPTQMDPNSDSVNSDNGDGSIFLGISIASSNESDEEFAESADTSMFEDTRESESIEGHNGSDQEAEDAEIPSDSNVIYPSEEEAGYESDQSGSSINIFIDMSD